jgi:hypothetical protein
MLPWRLGAHALRSIVALLRSKLFWRALYCASSKLFYCYAAHQLGTALVWSVLFAVGAAAFVQSASGSVSFACSVFAMLCCWELTKALFKSSLVQGPDDDAICGHDWLCPGTAHAATGAVAWCNASGCKCSAREPVSG